jgi:hypothetical protein
MSSVRRVFLTIALGAALGAGPAIAAPAMAQPNNNRSVQLTAFLTDNGVVGEPADPDGWGAATIEVSSRGRLCYNVFTRNLGPGIDADIFRSPRGDANGPGDHRVNLDMFGRLGSGCEWIGRELAWRIISNPRWYNVQVDSNTGAIRGQLRRSGNNWQ